MEFYTFTIKFVLSVFLLKIIYFIARYRNIIKLGFIFYFFFLEICEDLELRERIEQLRTEQESKRQAEAQKRKVRRSQSNNTR